MHRDGERTNGDGCSEGEDDSDGGGDGGNGKDEKASLLINFKGRIVLDSGLEGVLESTTL